MSTYHTTNVAEDGAACMVGAVLRLWKDTAGFPVVSLIAGAGSLYLRRYFALYVRVSGGTRCA